MFLVNQTSRHSVENGTKSKAMQNVTVAIVPQRGPEARDIAPPPLETTTSGVFKGVSFSLAQLLVGQGLDEGPRNRYTVLKIRLVGA